MRTFKIRGQRATSETNNENGWHLRKTKTGRLLEDSWKTPGRLLEDSWKTPGRDLESHLESHSKHQ